MARSRNIKPSISKNEDLSELSAHTRLLFILLPCYADCEGKLEDRPKRIHAEVFPYEHDIDVNSMLLVLYKYGFITRYSVNGKKYIWINNFSKHQNPHVNEKKKGSIIPDYKPESMIRSNGDTSTILEPDKNSSNRADSLNLIPDSLNLIPDSLNLIPDSLKPEPREKEKESLKDSSWNNSKQIDDPYFQQPEVSKDDLSQAKSVANWVNKHYKSTEFPSKIMPVIQNLLVSVSSDKIITAITNATMAFDREGRSAKHRPSLGKLLPNASAVMELLEMDMDELISGSEAKSGLSSAIEKLGEKHNVDK